MSLGVRAHDPDKCPIKSLVFEGYSPVLNGARIRARIPRYDKTGACVLNHTIHEEPRAYRLEETAVQIEILSGGPEVSQIVVARTDRARNYEDYLRDD